MRWKPLVLQSQDAGGGLVVTVGHPLVDDYLEFLRARARPNTILAVAFDLKVFFSVGQRRGRPLFAAGLDEIMRGARRRAGLDHASCHELRHTCLTRLREAGMSIEALQAQAGHASIETTRP